VPTVFAVYVKIVAVVLLENGTENASPVLFVWLLSRSMMSWCVMESFANRWNVITSPCRTVKVGPGSVMLFGVHPQPAGPRSCRRVRLSRRSWGLV